nr:lytic transglycosylase domain-containing protein [Blastocatellia bacterium]
MTKIFALITILAFAGASAFAQTSDAALRSAIAADNAARVANSGRLPNLSAAEHLSRAETYMANRMFPQAREHWSIFMHRFPDDAGVTKALFGTARSYMWEREYLTAVEWFEKLTKNHLNTKDGREGLAFKGASYVRAGKNLEAAKTYEQYTVMFPAGEKIESAHLNIIDAYREAGEYDKANTWVDTTTRKFAGLPTEVNALQSRVRMELYRENWAAAATAADALMRAGTFARSMTSLDEAKYLKALALEKAGKRAEANIVYSSIPNTLASYYGGLAAMHMEGTTQVKRISRTTPSLLAEYPVRFGPEVIRHAKANNIDPRFVLAIMKQESGFRPAAKSPAGARGLVQLVYDTALKYKDKAGYPRLQPDDLYIPAVNISLGSIYIAELKDEFDGMYEAIAASYNAGEDNAARWL